MKNIIKKSVSIFIVFAMLTVTSCSNEGELSDVSVFKEYEKAYKKVYKQESYTRTENVNLTATVSGKTVPVNLKSILSYQNINDEPNYHATISLNNGGNVAEGYYKDGSVYVNSALAKVMIDVPKVLVRPDLISFVKNSDKKSLKSGKVETYGASGKAEVLTMFFDSSAAVEYFNKIKAYGFNEINIDDLQPSEIKVVANINDIGVLMNETISFTILTDVLINNKTEQVMITYDAYVEFTDVGVTNIAFPDLSDHTPIDMGAVKQLISDAMEKLNVNAF